MHMHTLIASIVINCSPHSWGSLLPSFVMHTWDEVLVSSDVKFPIRQSCLLLCKYTLPPWISCSEDKSIVIRSLLSETTRAYGMCEPLSWWHLLSDKRLALFDPSVCKFERYGKVSNGQCWIDNVPLITSIELRMLNVDSLWSVKIIPIIKKETVLQCLLF